METSNLHYIPDIRLPHSQDFTRLKDDALEFIQHYGDTRWTNLNNSDPGVTILDQVCYALTELGYCNDFPIEDVIASKDEPREVRDQFYLPEDILTTSPVTVDDYRKYIVDEVAGVKNACFFEATFIDVAESETSKKHEIKGVYMPYLLLDDMDKSNNGKPQIHASFYKLNNSRNLNEVFLMPRELPIKMQIVEGRIDIDNEAYLYSYLLECEQKIADYIFPFASAQGYSQLAAKGIPTNDIFNGPRTKDGWILTAALGKKRNQLTIFEITNTINSITGCATPGLVFHSYDRTKQAIKKVTSKEDELIQVAITHSFEMGVLKVYCKGKPLHYNAQNFTVNHTLDTLDSNVVFPQFYADSETSIPKGKYRDIEAYYSIQHTFPEIYNVGAHSVDENASDLQIAQSRQLKGYLTLFDQVLANQFAQLANLGHLLSFKNDMTSAPHTLHAFWNVQEEYRRTRWEYPVPLLSFSPTYFCHSLYDIPQIRPLLKDNDTFGFSIDTAPDAILEKKSWDQYKLDPYNPYIKGLMEFTCTEDADLARRNNILNHLLARHGESPLVIDVIIQGSIYSGDDRKDRIIFKSLYLQNLDLLSYYRIKGYNFLAAAKLLSLNSITGIPKEYKEQIEGPYFKDSIINSHEIDRLEKLVDVDFINYSALELKFHLLFGLRRLYWDYISYYYNNDEGTTPPPDPMPLDIRIAYWLSTHRKGMIMIEQNLFSGDVNVQKGTWEKRCNTDIAGYVVTIKNNVTGWEYEIAKVVNDYESLWIVNTLSQQTNPGIDQLVTEGIWTFKSTIPKPPRAYKQIQVSKPVRICESPLVYWIVEKHANSGLDWEPVTENAGNTWSIYARPESNYQEYTSRVGQIIHLVLPAFIPLFGREAATGDLRSSDSKEGTTLFRTRVDAFMKTVLPVHQAYQLHIVVTPTLETLIEYYIHKHNSLIFIDPDRKTNNHHQKQ